MPSLLALFGLSYLYTVRSTLQCRYAINPFPPFSLNLDFSVSTLFRDYPPPLRERITGRFLRSLFPTFLLFPPCARVWFNNSLLQEDHLCSPSPHGRKSSPWPFPMTLTPRLQPSHIRQPGCKRDVILFPPPFNMTGFRMIGITHFQGPTPHRDAPDSVKTWCTLSMLLRLRLYHYRNKKL